LYASMGHWQQALAYAEKAHTFEKINYLQDREGAVSRLEMEYETEKRQVLLKAREEEIALKNENARTLRLFVLLLGVISLVTLGISVLFYRLYRKKQRLSKQNELLIREQNHRVKNNLQSISSLLSLQSHELQQDSKALEVINESRQRVESMAILHRKLYKNHYPGSAFLPDFLEEIAENVLNSYGQSIAQLEIEVEPLHLPANKAVHLGLILNELITNSCKYAFPSHPEPMLQIICKRTPDARLYLGVADNGDQGHIPPSGDGFGMQLIEMEVEQLYGKYHFSFHNGTLFTMTFPEKTPEPAEL
ncbi:MAG: sensor histidine kinase, partial [Leadbetterella sp.]|nr:sensor histidine kinase [Leadbetterella sp.]